MVYIAGQVAWDENSNVIGINDFATQTEKAFSNLKLAIEAADGTMENIVMVRIYIVDFTKEKSEVVQKALLEFFPKHPPASTFLPVPALANPDFMIEVEAQGVISKD